MSPHVKEVTLRDLLPYRLLPPSLEMSARALPHSLGVPMMLKGHHCQLSLSSTGLPRQMKPIPCKVGGIVDPVCG